MKALYAHAAHDVRLESCADTVPGSGRVAIGIQRGGLCGLPNRCVNIRFHGSANPFFDIQGAFRETPVADARPLITHSFSLSEYETAFATASDRSKAMKVQLEFT